MEVSWNERGLLLEVFLDGEHWRLVPKAGFLPLLTSLKAVATREEFLSRFGVAEEKLAFEKGVLLLQRSALSSALLREKLERKGFSSEVAEKVVSRLLELSLLCDESFAQAAARKYSKKYGNMRLRFELQRKKVPPSAIEELLKVAPAEEERILSHLPTEIPKEQKEKMRLYRSLARLGFSSDLIFRMLNSRSKNFFA